MNDDASLLTRTLSGQGRADRPIDPSHRSAKSRPDWPIPTERTRRPVGTRHDEIRLRTPLAGLAGLASLLLSGRSLVAAPRHARISGLPLFSHGLSLRQPIDFQVAVTMARRRTSREAWADATLPRLSAVQRVLNGSLVVEVDECVVLTSS